MSLIILPSSRIVKPPFGVGLKRSGLASGLFAGYVFNEGANVPYNLVPQVTPTTPALTGTSWVTGQYGSALANTATSDRFDTGLGNYAKTTGTILHLVSPAFSPTDSAVHEFWGARSGSEILEFLKHSDNNIYVGWSAGTDTRVVVAATSSNMVQSSYQTYVFTWNVAGTSAVSRLYRNGILLGSTTGTNTVSSTISFWINGSNNNNSGGLDGLSNGSATALFLMWNRALTAEEVIEVSRNPWQLFQSQAPSDRFWLFPTAEGPTLTLQWQGVDIK